MHTYLDNSLLDNAKNYWKKYISVNYLMTKKTASSLPFSLKPHETKVKKVSAIEEW